MPNLLNLIPQNLTLGIVILVMTLLAFFKGRKILYCLLISFFPAVMLYQAFVHWKVLTTILPDGFLTDTFVNRLGFYLFIYIFIFYIVQKLIGYEISRRGINKIIDSIFLALGLVSQSCILIFQTLDLPDFYHLSPAVEGFISSESGIIIMLIVAVFSLMYSSRA